MSSTQHRFPIVGVGASAGGIAAIEGLLAGLPEAPGVAFVVVTHLSPDRESMLHEVIGRLTQMPVTVAKDGAVVEPNAVYVMPPNTVLTISDGTLRLRRPNKVVRERKPIDIFFSALAEDQKEYAVAVVLSGGDGDGTLGAKAVKERGGLTLAQTADGSAPLDPHMPESAIGGGMIDLAVPVEQMGARIVAFARSFGTLALVADDDDRHQSADMQRARLTICEILQSHSGHDFSGYKTKTFLRRVRRRMQVLQLSSFEAYVERLRRDAAEVTNLFLDLLINVTNFFRDAEAFEALEKLVIPKLFLNRTAGDTVRVWVPGCATGEEVYSIAMLMREHLDTLEHAPRVQIFATDIDEAALGVARSGRYPEQLLDGVSPARRQRFFNNDGASYAVTSEVRELCMFSPHSVIRDPPFSRMDLVSCRNLLIYFGPEVQNRVIPTFHYALKPGGYLFLGTSESISQHADLFATLDKKNRLFQSRENASRQHRLPILSGDPRQYPSNVASGASAVRGLVAHSLRQQVEAQVMERFAPAHVVVSGDGDVVYYSAGTGRFLEPSQGAPSRQILTMARRGLRPDLRSALRDAASTRVPVVRENVAVEDEDSQTSRVRLTVQPLALQDNSEPLYLVVFERTTEPGGNGSKAHTAPMADNLADVERELRDTRERLQATIEEYETALEELKSSNEELVSVNEEAQSTNEELEASKEEMQSLNEELNTINTELTGKIEDLDRVNNDLRNLFEGTQIATVFLDRHLVMRNFTPAASSFFNLRASDVGRPLTDLSSRLDYPELEQHIVAVFGTGEMFEHQLPKNSDRKHFLVRLVPYRNDGGRTDGVVVTLVDVTTLAEAEDHQQVLIAELNHRVKNMLAVVISVANHTLKAAKSPQDFTGAFTGRLHAMARAYGLLSRRNWKDASVDELVRQEVEAFDARRFDLSGPDVHLHPQQGLSVGMVVHELATNASKYGALSKSEGRVSVVWSIADGQFRLEWREKDGPAVLPPDHDGFGLSLVKAEISYRLGGQLATAFEPTGFVMTMSFPLNP